MVLQDSITRERQEDLAKIVSVLDQIVAEFGYDYVYPHARFEETGVGGRCMYVENKDAENFDCIYGMEMEQLKPSCIIGQLATRLGIPMEELIAVNDEGYTEMARFITIPHTHWFYGELDNLQQRQDKGMSWGQAVDMFKRETGEKAA